MANSVAPPLIYFSTFGLLPLLLIGVVTADVYSRFPTNVLYSNQTLKKGESLSLENLSLTMQQDCNLVLYDAGAQAQVWSTGTAGRGKRCYLIMQNDGNLVVYNREKAPVDKTTMVWQSNSSLKQVAIWALVLRSTREILIYGPGFWSNNPSVPRYIHYNSVEEYCGKIPGH